MEKLHKFFARGVIVCLLPILMGGGGAPPSISIWSPLSGTLQEDYPYPITGNASNFLLTDEVTAAWVNYGNWGNANGVNLCTEDWQLNWEEDTWHSESNVTFSEGYWVVEAKLISIGSVVASTVTTGDVDP